MSDCVRCSLPVADTGYACHACATRLSIALLRAALLVGELDTTIARLDHIGEGGESSAETPLPFDWDASDAAWAIHNTLTTWARHVSEQRGILITGTRTIAVAAWLARHTAWLRVRPEAQEAFDELHSAARLLWRTVDTHVERWYAGKCGLEVPDEWSQPAECEGDLYVFPGAEWVTCPECGASFSAEDRKAELLDQVRDHLTNAETIARALSTWGWQVTSAQVRGYAFRGRLLPHAKDERDRPLYRIGDVIDLLVQATRRGEKVPA
ncbi:MAG TPA: hypothetical protein VIV56_01900 [Gemmatimonadales bacterium]